jgi:hypothetical protein
VNACSLELLYSGNRQSTVTRAAGNHDGTGKRMLAVRQLQRKGTLAGVDRSIQSNHFIGDGHFDAEFLRLIEGAPHQGNAGNSSRKAQIIFNACGGAGLSTECAAVESQHGDSFRSRVDAAASPGRTSADDHDIKDTVRVYGPNKSDAASQLSFGWVAQQAVRQDTRRSATGWDRCGKRSISAFAS